MVVQILLYLYGYNFVMVKFCIIYGTVTVKKQTISCYSYSNYMDLLLCINSLLVHFELDKSELTNC